MARALEHVLWKRLRDRGFFSPEKRWLWRETL